MFQLNLIFVCIEEAHVMREWLTFRHLYGYIGQLLRGRLHPEISVFGLSATLEPGAPTAEVCQSLGFRNFTLFRFSNEHRDIQFVIQPLKHAITSRSYPQLLPYLNTGRKVVIYVPSLEISTRVYIYLIRLDGSGLAGRQVRQYNALCHPDFNSETLRLMETDSHLQIIIATVALANGVHCSTIQDVLSIGMPKTLSQTEQQGGRAARLPDATGRSVIFVQKSDITQAKKFIACEFPFQVCFSYLQVAQRWKPLPPQIHFPLRILSLGERKNPNQRQKIWTLPRLGSWSKQRALMLPGIEFGKTNR
jgi:superfamily II DNA helicase RecQ